jgi:epsilon-lactone hydrolase
MSVKAKMMHVMMRYRHFLKGKLRADIINKNTSVAKLRSDTEEAAARLVRLSADITTVPADFDGFYAEWVIPANAAPDKAILYFHGGGFVMGSAKSHRGIVSGFAKRLGYQALVFDYSLAPEAPAPAATYDAVRIYRWLLDQGYAPEKIIFSGDSAGGWVEF